MVYYAFVVCENNNSYKTIVIIVLTGRIHCSERFNILFINLIPYQHIFNPVTGIQLKITGQFGNSNKNCDRDPDRDLYLNKMKNPDWTRTFFFFFEKYNNWNGKRTYNLSLVRDEDLVSRVHIPLELRVNTTFPGNLTREGWNNSY